MRARVPPLLVTVLVLSCLSATARAGSRSTGEPWLQAASPGSPCAGAGFEVRHGGRLVSCSHGPDTPASPRGSGLLYRATSSSLKVTAPTPTSAHLVPCIGDGKSGDRIQAIYAHPSGTTGRFTQIAPLIRTWASQINGTYNASAAETGGSRQIRWVTRRCQLKILNITLPAAAATDFGTTHQSLVNQGLHAKNRKYMVWMDADGFCGIGDAIPDTSPGSTNQNNSPGTNPFAVGMVAQIDRGCWGQLGEPFNLDPGSVEAHELTHTLGAVQSAAPNATTGGHCKDEFDVMCYLDGTVSVLRNVCTFHHGALLDCKHNDYYTTHEVAGTYLDRHWNTGNSDYLARNLPPGNDRFPNAEPLDQSGIAVGSNRLATRQTGEPGAAGQRGVRSVWYQFKAGSNGTLTIDTLGSSFNTVLALYTGTSVGSLHVVGANDDARGGLRYSRVEVSALSGTRYWVKVDGKAGAQGSVVLHSSFGPQAPVITGFTPTSGPPGTTVTAHGTNLLPSGSFLAMLDGKQATLSPSSTDTDLVFTVPAGAGTGPFTIRTANTLGVSDTNFKVT